MRESENGEFTFGIKEKVAVAAGVGSLVGLLVTSLVIAVKGGQFAGEMKTEIRNVTDDVGEIKVEIRASIHDRWTRTDHNRFVESLDSRLVRIEQRLERLEAGN